MIEEYKHSPIVDKYNIEDGQTVVIHIPVDKLSPTQAQNYLGSVVQEFRKEFDEKDKKKVVLFAFPHHPGKDRPSLEVIAPPKPGSILVFNIPVGNVPKTEVPKYLKMVKEQLLSEDWDKKYPGCNLLVTGVFEDGKKIEIKVK